MHALINLNTELKFKPNQQIINWVTPNSWIRNTIVYIICVENNEAFGMLIIIGH